MTEMLITDTYHERARQGRFALAAHCFTEDAFYSGAAVDPRADGVAGGRLEARGREAIAALLSLRGRGVRVYELATDLVDGSRIYLRGTVATADGAVLGSVLAIAEIAPGGLITSYQEYEARPPVGSAAVVSSERDVTPATSGAPRTS